MSNKKVLSTVFTSNGLTTQKQKTEFLQNNAIGLKVQRNSYPIGTKVYWKHGNTYWSGSSIYNLYIDDSTRLGSGVYASELMLLRNPLSVEGLKEESKQVEKDQKAITKRKADIKTKLAFLKEAGVDEFTENEYKAYMTLKTIEKKDLTDVQKAQAIAKLIDG